MSTSDTADRWLKAGAPRFAAARAYDAKARELYGPFARCNFPEEVA